MRVNSPTNEHVILTDIFFGFSTFTPDRIAKFHVVYFIPCSGVGKLSCFIMSMVTLLMWW